MMHINALIYLFMSSLEDDCKGSVSDEVFSAVFKVSHRLHFLAGDTLQLVMERLSGTSSSNSR